MQVQVRFYAELARLLGGGQRQRTLTLPDGSLVGDLLLTLAAPDDLAIIVGQNGRLAEPSAPLAEGDQLELMTAMEGGSLDRRPQGGKRFLGSNSSG